MPLCIYRAIRFYRNIELANSMVTFGEIVVCGVFQLIGTMIQLKSSLERLLNS